MKLTADTWRDKAAVFELLSALKTNVEVNRQGLNELTNMIAKESKARPSYKEITSMITTDLSNPKKKMPEMAVGG